MEKFSVKKPFTVLVAVVAILALGFTSIQKMTTDLLPEMRLLNMVIVTIYPGASPERVEDEVTDVLENALGTLSGLKQIYSTSAENYSMVSLDFEDGTDMNSTWTRVTSAIQQVEDSLPESCPAPYVMEYSMDMMATMYISISRDGYDIYELSDFINDTVVPELQRQNGVSSITATGLVTQMVQIAMNQEKIDVVNGRILETVNSTLAEAKAELDSAEKQVKDGQKEWEKTKKTFGETVSSTVFNEMSVQIGEITVGIQGRAEAILKQLDKLLEKINDPTISEPLEDARVSLDALVVRMTNGGIRSLGDLLNTISDLRNITDNVFKSLGALKAKVEQQLIAGEISEEDAAELQELINSVYEGIQGLHEALDGMPATLESLQGSYAELTQAQLEAAVQLSAAQNMLENYQEQLDEAWDKYNSAREYALKNANVESLLNIEMLSKLVYAQNFEMPAGYINDRDDHSWMLKVGEEYESVDQMAGALLCSIDGIGDIYLSDVADITVIDNAGDSYTRMNGEQAVILEIFKSSGSSAHEVSENCKSALDKMTQKYDGFESVVLMNQGNYITMILRSVLMSMAVGSLLAILVLALFLRDIRPTMVVAVSIPLSVLFALVLMYFTNLTINMMTLSGLLLGIGMLVDNSIVVIENIYRLRGRGVGAARAAVQGARQVKGSIVASTLTSVCVFLPLIFISGDVTGELLVPIGMCIGYCLMASLVVALTVVPAAGSTLLKRVQSKKHPFFDKVQDIYAASLSRCLRYKFVPIVLSVALLAFSVWKVTTTGIVMLPEMTSTEIQVDVTTAEGLTEEQSREEAGKVAQAIREVEGVANVGIMEGNSITASLGSMVKNISFGGYTLNDLQGYGGYTCYVTLDNQSATNQEVNQISGAILEAVQDLSSTVSISSSGLLSLLDDAFGSGMQLCVRGKDIDTLVRISEDVKEIVNSTEGFANATNGMESAEQTVHLRIDKDRAAACGLTVAQIYMEIASRLTTSTTSTTVRVDGKTMDVKIVDTTNLLTLENLLDISFTTSTLNADGTTSEETHLLSEFAATEEGVSPNSILRHMLNHYVQVNAETMAGYNTTVQSRVLKEKLAQYEAEGNLPDGYVIDMGGETESVGDMASEMVGTLALGLLLVYLIMVAEFQSLLSPFIVLFTIPLAFTGGMFGLLLLGESLSLTALMGFLVLMGTVVNNGIVFVDYTNQLRKGGLNRREALIATGKTRMRPILMTALTTVLAMVQMLFSDDMAGQLTRGMAVVIIGGMVYATVMTLYIVPVMYDVLFKRKPLDIDIGNESLDDIPDDAAEYLEQAQGAAITV